MATHYDVLGVAPDAPISELRRAYVDRARALHPDRGSGDARRMQEVNEAWRVLRDPARRRAYDQSLRPAPSAPPPDPDVDPLDVPFHPPLDDPVAFGATIARALPWVAILVVLAAIFLVTAVAGSGDGGDDVQDLVDRCVAIGRASSVDTVPCSAPNDGRVVLVVDRPSYCPDGSEGRSVSGDEWLCLQPVRR